MPSDIWARWLDEVDREGAGSRQLRLLRSQVRDRVLHRAGLRRGHRVVDLGCGGGFLALEAARLVGPEGMVTAVDSSPGALATLTRRALELDLRNIRPVEADIARLPLGEGEADAVVARSVLSYVPDRPAALREAFRVLKPGGIASLFEPVLAEEELMVDWGDQRYLWERFLRLLKDHHPAYGFDRSTLVGEVRDSGFEEVDFFTWHADVTRPYEGEGDIVGELRLTLPGELSIAACLLSHGATEEEISRVARRLAEESTKPSYRDILPCVFVWGVKPSTTT